MSESLTTENDLAPMANDQWCGHCKRWVARYYVTPFHTHDGSTDEGCGYQVYAQDHPCFRNGLPKAERARHG